MRSIAESLGWPLLTVTPSVLLRSGLEGFEQRSDKVFSNLMAIRRAVVFFDECEELIRRRAEDTEGERTPVRTMAAFTTPGMLTRLQDLRGTAWVIFAFATNAAVKLLDNAATRHGRFDVELKLLYPTREARRRYVLRRLANGSPFGVLGDIDQQAIADLIASKTEDLPHDVTEDWTETDYGRLYGISFSVVDTIVDGAHDRWLAEGARVAPLECVRRIIEKRAQSRSLRDLLEAE
jgi:SpoVK/Ycf46/Vps4 family AAA+-type ATPase